MVFPKLQRFQRIVGLSKNHRRDWRPLHAGHARGSLVLAHADARSCTMIIPRFVIMCARRHYARAYARPPRWCVWRKMPFPRMRSSVSLGGQWRKRTSPLLASSLEEIALWCSLTPSISGRVHSEPQPSLMGCEHPNRARHGAGANLPH
jgi:hypothetical protein